jgi:hypothetical protein
MSRAGPACHSPRHSTPVLSPVLQSSPELVDEALIESEGLEVLWGHWVMHGQFEARPVRWNCPRYVIHNFICSHCSSACCLSAGLCSVLSNMLVATLLCDPVALDANRSTSVSSTVRRAAPDH